MIPRGLFISWVSPAYIEPMMLSFSVWINCSLSFFISDKSVKVIIRLDISPLLPSKGIALIGGTVVGGTAGYAVGSEKITDWESAIVLYPYRTESLKELNCEKLPVKQ